MMTSGAEKEEVYTLLLTNIAVDSLVKDYYHDHLLRNEIGKVISVHLDDSEASAIVKVKVKAATAANLLEEVQGNLKQRDRSEKVQFLYSESSTTTLNWNASMKPLATGMIAYARKHYPMMEVKHVEGIQVTISGVVHDVIALQKQYNHHVARNTQSLVPPPVSASALDPPAVRVDSTVLDPPTVDSTASEANSTIKEYPNLNPDILALLQKLPEGKIPGLRYDIKRGCVIMDDSCSSEEETLRISTFQAKYQEIVAGSSRKLRVDALEIPEKLSDQAVKGIISSYDAKYNQCVFIMQEDPRAVRVISNSSRQFEQAKKILKDGLNQSFVSEGLNSATSLTSSESMVIPLPGGRKLTLKQADIVMEEVDIIVNAANKNLDHGAGVAGAINRASNGAVQRYSDTYIRKNGQLQPGQAAVTKAGGSLKCKYIIHAVGPTKYEHNATVCERLLHDVMNRVLKEAEKVNAQSIAVPAISSGIFGVGKEVVAKCVTDSIQSYRFSKSPPTLADIRIVIIDHPTHSVFAQLFAARMAISTHSNPDPHKSTTHPLSSSSDRVTVSSSPSPSRNATDMMSLPKETPKGVPACASEFTTKGIASGTMRPSSSTMSATENARHPAEKVGTPMSVIIQMLMPISDRWYALGLELGFSNAEMDNINSASATLHCAQIEVIVKEGVRRCGDLAKFVNILTTALQSPKIAANEVAVTLAKSVPSGTVKPSSSTMSTTENASLPAEKAGAPMSDVTAITQILMPIADKWYILGLELGFSNADMDMIKSASATLHCAQIEVIVKEGVNRCGDLAKFLNILTTALQSPKIGANEVAMALAKNTRQLSLGSDAPILRPMLHRLAEKWRILGELLGFDHHTLLRISSVAAYGMGYSKAATVSEHEHPMIRDVNVILSYLAPICQKWHVLGLLLGMNHEELAKLKGDSDPVACLGVVISSWLSGRCSEPATMESLTGALRSQAINGESIATNIEQQLLKKVGKKGIAVGGDTSGIRYPSLPASDDEDLDENKNPTVPHPGYDAIHGGTNIPPTLHRSLSDPHTSPLSSLPTGSESHNRKFDNYAHAAGSHVAVTGGQAVKNRLAASFDLKEDEHRPLLGNQHGSSKHKIRSSGSSKPHTVGGHSKVQPSTAPNTAEPKNDKCVICLEDFKDPVMTRCNHTFCRRCIDRAVAASPYCPICKTALRAIVGNQPPNGSMTTRIHEVSLPGYEGHRTIQITYVIPDGTQGQNHPNPGRRYKGATRVAYLPDSPEGQEVLMLLKKAFEARLVFTVGDSVTTGTKNTIVWNDIHHKTSLRGGTYGYPDPGYLQRVKEDLAAKGIVLGPEDAAV